MLEMIIMSNYFLPVRKIDCFTPERNYHGCFLPELIFLTKHEQSKQLSNAFLQLKQNRIHSCLSNFQYSVTSVTIIHV